VPLNALTELYPRCPLQLHAVDLPTDWEGRFFRTPARKLLWVFLQPAFYGLRPLLVNPKPLAPWELFNVTVQLAFDAILCWSFRLHAGVYLLLSTLLGMGLHPTAYHFISEVRALTAGRSAGTRALVSW